MPTASATPTAATPATDAPTATLTRAVFALLVLATFAAFFVTQRLKHSPTLVQAAAAVPFIYPANGHRTALISFKIKQPDVVTVTVLGPDGRAVDTLATDLRMAAYQQRGFRWRGVTASGQPAPFGVYTIRVRLRDADRSVVLTRANGEVATIRVEGAPR